MTDEIDKYRDAKTAFFAEFEALRPDLMYSEGWTENEQKLAAELLRPAKVKVGMLASIPLRCEGSRCPFAQSCPLEKEGLAPVGRACPIEMSIVQQFFYDYVKELDVDVERMVEVSIVRDLVDQEVQHMRKTWLLSQEHFIQENVVGIDDQGNVITKKELHQAVEYEDRILKRKERLRNALLATREAKAKAGQSQADSAQVISNIMEEVRRVEIERKKETKRRLGTEEVDEYIEAEIIDMDDSDY